MDYQTANITYKGLSDKGRTVQLTDEAKKNWTVWKADKDNPDEPSDVYEALQQFKFGDSFGVKYGEKQESFIGKDGKTVNYTKRTIYQILPLITNPTVKPASKSAPRQEQTYQDEAKSVDWDEVAVGKTQSLFLAAYIQSGHNMSEAKLQVVQARQLAELVVYGTQKNNDDEPLPEPFKIVWN